jgi:hypothetical protein
LAADRVGLDKGEEMTEPLEVEEVHSIEGYVGGELVFSAEGADADAIFSEAMRYAVQYIVDGEVSLFMCVAVTKRKLLAKLSRDNGLNREPTK